MNREECLNQAKECVTKDRQNTYGSPENNFGRIANLWNAYLNIPYQITSVDVAVMMALLKVARIAHGVQNGVQHEDNFIDGCGYFACACELQTE
jgi:ribosomal protein L20